MKKAQICKKAQIHMTETIMVLLIFFIILFFGIFIYYKYTFKSIEATSLQIEEQKTNVFLSLFPAMPEFSARQFASLDTAKLLAFKQVYSQNQEHYQNLFGYKTIIIEQVYPEQQQQQCTVNTYMTGCNTYIVYDNPISSAITKLNVSLPISLYFPVNDKYAIGKIYLTSYE